MKWNTYIEQLKHLPPNTPILWWEDDCMFHPELSTSSAIRPNAYGDRWALFDYTTNIKLNTRIPKVRDLVYHDNSCHPDDLILWYNPFDSAIYAAFHSEEELLYWIMRLPDFFEGSTRADTIRLDVSHMVGEQ